MILMQFPQRLGTLFCYLFEHAEFCSIICDELKQKTLERREIKQTIKENRNCTFVQTYILIVRIFYWSRFETSN